MKFIGGLIVLIASLSASAQVVTTTTTTETTTMTMGGTYTDNLNMREQRKLGVGTQVGGTAGMLGLLLELNLQREDAATVALGFGDTYGTFTVAWKHNFEGKVFTPYTTLGWSRWYSSSTNSSSSHILESMLTRAEREDGRFGLDLIAAGGGMQYQELDGDFAGATLFGEIDMMVAPFRGRVMPTASVGATYFF